MSLCYSWHNWAYKRYRAAVRLPVKKKTENITVAPRKNGTLGPPLEHLNRKVPSHYVLLLY